jgi:protein arginine kinase activator
MKCDKCNKPATVHLTEIQGGKQISKHLCEQCAAQGGENLITKAHAPINELLTNFVLAHSSLPKEGAAVCEHCGITWAEFRQGGLLGCEHDYVLFDKDLTPLLQRAHENATHHLGKAPARAGQKQEGGVAVKPVIDVAKLRKDLAKAVAAEDYERAAKLRDQIKQAGEV